MGYSPSFFLGHSPILFYPLSFYYTVVLQYDNHGDGRGCGWEGKFEEGRLECGGFGVELSGTVHEVTKDVICILGKNIPVGTKLVFLPCV